MTSVECGESEKAIVFNDQLDPQIERQTSALFEVDQAEVLLLCPSLECGTKALEAYARAGSKSVADTEDNDSTAEDAADTPENSDKQASNRKFIRENMRMYGNHVRRLARTGVRLAESYDDIEEGRRVSKEILTNVTGDVLIFAWDDYIAPAVEPLRNIRSVSQEISSEIAATANDTNKRYTLLKILSLGYGTERQHEVERKFSNAADWRPAKALTVLGILAESPIQSELTAELNKGLFDRLIARDILQFIKGNSACSPDFVKLHQFVTFLEGFTDTNEQDRPALYERMVAHIADWPPDQLQAIMDARQVLRGTMSANFGHASSMLRENGLTGREGLATAFEKSIVTLAEEFLKRIPATGSAKAEVAIARAKLRTKKRPKVQEKPKKGKARRPAPVEEVPQEPRTLLTCNLNDHTTTEGVAGLIDSFVERTSQGDTTIREDLERMAQFMTRTDLPPAHRRGIYSLPDVKVRFGDDNKLWDLFEFKPTDAAGLSLRTQSAKDSRAYFIKLSSDSWGIVGIEPRKDQEAFLKSVRAKIKIRG